MPEPFDKIQRTAGLRVEDGQVVCSFHLPLQLPFLALEILLGAAKHSSRLRDWHYGLRVGNNTVPETWIGRSVSHLAATAVPSRRDMEEGKGRAAETVIE